MTDDAQVFSDRNTRDTLIRCRGWWEQHPFGRHEMDPLFMRFQGSKLTGRGQDIVGPFDLTGEIQPGAIVSIMKQYAGLHSVIYKGTWDGEGTLSGIWHLPDNDGRWQILLGRPASVGSFAVHDIRPTASA